MACNLCLPLAGFPNISTVFHWLSKRIVPPPTHSTGNTNDQDHYTNGKTKPVCVGG